MSEPAKRPLLPAEDRARLRKMAGKAQKMAESGMNRAYCQGVWDVLTWLDSEDMSPMLHEMTR